MSNDLQLKLLSEALGMPFGQVYNESQYLRGVIQLFASLCDRHNLDWAIERGSEYAYAVVITYQNALGAGWDLLWECNDLRSALLDSAAKAYHNLLSLNPSGQVLDLEEYRKKLR